MVWAGLMINGRTRLHVVANGAMTGQRYIDEVLFLMFVFSVVLSVINLFLWTTTQHVIEHSLFRIAFYSTSRMASAFSSSKCVGCFGDASCWSNYPPTNKYTLIRALTEEWDKLPQQLLDNVVQSMLWSAMEQMWDADLALSPSTATGLTLPSYRVV
ncbi:hypothetical protein TNCV_3393521 [Trichonephila clavipes]|nr:hypothetical protein TNCV_3393521 [Trichonephila clavipes]